MADCRTPVSGSFVCFANLLTLGLVSLCRLKHQWPTMSSATEPCIHIGHERTADERGACTLVIQSGHWLSGKDVGGSRLGVENESLDSPSHTALPRVDTFAYLL